MVTEERELWERESAGEGGPEDRVRLQELKVHLDQAWDLLRQRRGLSEAGFDENGAHIRGRWNGGELQAVMSTAA